jgi:four helix bundle protein
MLLENLQVYKLARKLSQQSWLIYSQFSWQLKKIVGDQFIEAVDSIGANIAEGYGRFHYLDRIKFMYNARGSLLESKHWIELLFERQCLVKKDFNQFINTYNNLAPTLNAFINSIYKSKNSQQPNI